jgi:Rieske Fe-S protein
MTRDETHGCGSCPLGDAIERRDFLRDAVAGALVAIGALHLLPARLDALPIAVARSTGGSRTDKSYPIPATDGVAVDKSESVIVARFENKAYAFSLACPHQNTAIRWQASDKRFQCPKHKSRYQPDGTFIDGRATRGLDRFAVKRDADSLVVNLDLLYRQDENAAEWAAAFVPLSSSEK